MQSPSYDILILGAGVAGCATALALKQLHNDLRILMVDRKAKNFNSDNEEVRIGETLPPHAATRLRELNLWDDFQKADFQKSYGTAASWGSEELYHNEFMLSPYGYGWHIDRNRFDQLLIEKCLAKEVEIIFKTSTKGEFIRNQEDWEVTLFDGKKEKKIKSRLLMDATGKKAFLATKLGAKKTKTDQLIGISKAYETANHKLAGSGAMVESVANGWWYSSVLDDTTSILCFMTDADISRDKAFTDEDNFERQLQNTIHTKLRVGQSKSRLQIKAAHSQILDRTVGDGWLAVGDSASSYDPLSALGVFKALNMSKYASFAAMDYIKGNARGLNRYDNIVKADYKSFLEKKNDYYNEEERFIQSTFWSRRSKSLSVIQYVV